MLDTVREIHTPEGVDLRLPAAGPMPRALAWVIDFGLRMGLLMAGSMLFALMGDAGMGLYLVVLFAVVWLYPIVCECLLDGRSPGKRALGLKVVSSDGAPIGWMASIVRNLMRTVDMLPFGYACGLMAGLADPWGRRLGDLVAGSMVIHVPPKHAIRPAIASADTVSPLVHLQPKEQSAVLAFGERAPKLTPERQVELADLASPVTGACGQEGVVRLYGVAHWLLGDR